MKVIEWIKDKSLIIIGLLLASLIFVIYSKNEEVRFVEELPLETKQNSASDNIADLTKESSMKEGGATEPRDLRIKIVSLEDKLDRLGKRQKILSDMLKDDSSIDEMLKLISSNESLIREWSKSTQDNTEFIELLIEEVEPHHNLKRVKAKLQSLRISQKSFQQEEQRKLLDDN